MSMAIKEGYVNPLIAMERNRRDGKTHGSFTKKSEAELSVKDLEIQQQTLKNEILLKKATGGDVGAEKPDGELEQRLQQISTELKSAKTQQVSSGGDEEHGKAARPPRFDIYERSGAEAQSAGLYKNEFGKFH